MLALLREEHELAAGVGIPAPTEDEEASLIAAVAVLSQRDNVERLWDRLKERCEQQKRPATANEKSLLRYAIEWHSLNWSQPWQKEEPQPGSAFDFERYQRPLHMPTGERIKAVWLPGIVDSQKKTVRKPLVETDGGELS